MACGRGVRAHHLPITVMGRVAVVAHLVWSSYPLNSEAGCPNATRHLSGLMLHQANDLVKRICTFCAEVIARG